MLNKSTAILVLAIAICNSGCIATIPYWKSVEKQQEETFVLQDEMKWQEREKEMKAKKAAEANTPVPDKPFKASDF